MTYAVEHQVTGPKVKDGPQGTNTYLVYDVASREAAFIDVGGPADLLTAAVDQKGLLLKYVFASHCHVDHVFGVPAVRLRYPEAKWCLSKEDWEDTGIYSQWETVFPPAQVAHMKATAEKEAEIAAWLDFDFSQLGEPDVFLEDGQAFHLGEFTLSTILSPGHSRGSICFHVGDALFAGDLLMRETAGRADLPRCGGPEKRRQSILRLYDLHDDDTVVYSGHGPVTTIGHEKLHNSVVRADS